MNVDVGSVRAGYLAVLGATFAVLAAGALLDIHGCAQRTTY